MGYRLFLILLLLVLLSDTSIAAVFVITSNADSGPGTLREALTKAAANGSAEKDYINFNLPDLSEAGRTITIESQLPGVSSNIAIDGSTQPGNKFGPSDAKIAITANIYAFANKILSGTYAFYIYEVSDVELYGLFITKFYGLSAVGSSDMAVNILNSKNIRIGAAGKGNWINSCGYYIVVNSYNNLTPYTESSDINIQANYLGYDITPTSFATEGVNIRATNVVIGGDLAVNGNHIATPLATNGDHIKISHNTIGIDGNGDESKYFLPQLECDNGNDLEVSYNTSVLLRLNLQKITNFNVYANLDMSTYPKFSLTSIGMFQCTNGIIGSEDESLQNRFVTNTGITNYTDVTIANVSSKNIQVLKNEIICAQRAYLIHLETGDNISIPNIKVLINNPNEYSGTASPLSDIYVYYDDSDCPVCSPLKFYTKIKTDPSGAWKITGNFAGKKWVSSALLLQNSSEFTQPLFDNQSTYYKKSNPSCGKQNGAIELLESGYKNILNFTWYNSKNEKIGEGPILKDIGPGTYYVNGYNGGCFTRSEDIYLADISPTIADVDIKKTNPVCGNDGGITGLVLIPGSNNQLALSWVDEKNKQVGNQLEIHGLNAGVYTLIVTDQVTGCDAKYGPIVLKSTGGLIINDDAPKVQSTNCDQSNGSIKNIIVSGGTGTRHFTWKNNQQQEVSYTQDLTSQPAGKYTLQVTDDSQCAPVFSKSMEILEVNGITIMESPTPATPASCGKANGSVTGVTARGGTKYEWRDANGNLSGGGLDLKNVPAGAYQLTVSNDYCQKQSQVYHVLEAPGTVYPSTYTIKNTQACYANANGSLSLTADALVKSYGWENDKQQNVGTNTDALNLPPGSYKLYLTDQNGCKSYYNTYQVTELPQFKIVDYGQKADDRCGLKTGSVKGVIITGGLPPYTYKWINDAGQPIGNTNSIENLAAGNYKLSVLDARCGDVEINFNIALISTDVGPPSLSDTQVCTPGDAFLFVNDVAPGFTYRLYDMADSATPLDEQANGRFKISATSNRSFFVSRVSGSCEGARVEVKVSVGLSPLNIANTFTPNGDGHNDYWKINGIENYPQALVQVFNRNGQKLFESRGYATPFNGTYNGKALPEGTYYYIINLNKNCNLLSGSLTILR